MRRTEKLASHPQRQQQQKRNHARLTARNHPKPTWSIKVFSPPDGGSGLGACLEPAKDPSTPPYTVAVQCLTDGH